YALSSRSSLPPSSPSFFFTDPATTAIYTLSLHDALPIWLGYYPAREKRRRPTVAGRASSSSMIRGPRRLPPLRGPSAQTPARERSEEHTSELQSRSDLVCRLLLEKKKKKKKKYAIKKKKKKEKQKIKKKRKNKYKKT